MISAIARSRWWRATKANEGTDHELLRDRCEYRTGSVQGQCRLCQANHALLQSQCWVALAAVAEVAKAWEEYQYFRSGGTVTAPRTDKFEGVGSPLSSHLSLFSHFFFQPLETNFARNAPAPLFTLSGNSSKWSIKYKKCISRMKYTDRGRYHIVWQFDNTEYIQNGTHVHVSQAANANLLGQA